MTAVSGQAMNQNVRFQTLQEVAYQSGIPIPVKQFNFTSPMHLSKPCSFHDVQKVQLYPINTKPVQLFGHGKHFRTRFTRQPENDMGADP